LTKIGHGNTEATDHLIEDVAEKADVRSLSEDSEEASEVPSVGDSVFAFDADEQTKRCVAFEFIETAFDGGVSKDDGKEQDAPEYGDAVGIASVVPSSPECFEERGVRDGLESVSDGGERG